LLVKTALSSRNRQNYIAPSQLKIAQDFSRHPARTVYNKRILENNG
jgi:hypothetical protein